MSKKYDPDTKAAVMSALLEGQAAAYIAREYSIPVGTVRSWKSRLQPVATVATEKKEEIGDLLIKYLRINLTTLQKQALIFRNEEWLLGHSPSEAAVLHGVLTDKSIRLLEALSNATGD